MAEIDFNNFVQELDAAMQAHLEWSRRILRCAVLHASPGDDALKPEAHTLCRFGRWLDQYQSSIESLDEKSAKLLIAEHRAMHDAVRALCSCILAGQRGQVDDLEMFENKQTHLIELLAHFKTLAVTRSSQIDALTGLALRHNMEHDFDILRKNSQRHRESIGVLMVDVDHFKSINDQHGHDGGDTVLKHLAEVLKQTLRENDFAYRFGGEEFILLMQFAHPEDAEFAAQRVLDAVRRLSIMLPNDRIVEPTVTVGIAIAGRRETLCNVIQRADTALYEGKASGRNCFVIAGDSEEKQTS